jgi:hypothetical protein
LDDVSQIFLATFLIILAGCSGVISLFLAVILIVVVLVVFVISECRIELLENCPIEINCFFSIEERYVLNAPVHSKIAVIYEQTMKLMLFSYDSVYLLYSHRSLMHDLGLV